MKVREGGREGQNNNYLGAPLPESLKSSMVQQERQSTHGFLMLHNAKKWPTFEFVKLTLSKNEIERRREEQPHS